MSASRRHVFISHRFVDDDSVDRLTGLLSRGGWDVRNSSIRLKQANIDRKNNGQVSDRALERVLRRKITWAQSVIVVIGSTTSDSRWVKYEITEAHKQGKKIVGVYARGCTDAKVPAELESYATSIVAWNTNAIMQALDGSAPAFQTPDGAPRAPRSNVERSVC
jgi:hypothetical protein